MATLTEIREQIFNNSDFINKCEAAVIIAIHDILNATPTVAEKELAEKAINDVSGYGKKAAFMVSAKNKDLTIEAILALDNGTLTTEIKAVVLLFTGA